ncbi:class I SAM-dependent methyltransferase [Brevibacterium litoralis]|uniref:class I SAM-dependent methyltransferase n=1 Tax=Brevibacterium litoralis TaxID=3138935 RepID=UPI0032EC7AF9
MTPETLARLLDTRTLDRIDTIEWAPSTELAQATALRKEGFDPEVASAMLLQAQLRTEAVDKFGPFAADMLLTRDGLAQATRLPVAAHHARRMLSAVPGRIADLGCGLGADALAFAGMDGVVEAVEADEVTAALATWNLRHLENASVTHGLAEDYDLDRADAVWLDPARRKGTTGKGEAFRLNDPEAFSPPLSWAFSVADRVSALGIKLGPALDHSLVPAGWEAQWVSHGRDVVEVALYAGAAIEAPGRNALVLGPEGAVRVHESQVPADDEEGIGTLGEYLHEPDGAVVRAGLVTALCEPLAARRVSAPIAYLTGDRLPEGPAASLVRTWRVREVLPAGMKPLRKALVARGIGQVVIKKRGADIVPDAVRRKLKLPAGSRATLVFTRLGEDHVVLLADEV